MTTLTKLLDTKQQVASRKKKGRSQKAQVLVAALEKATANFLDKGQQIADENAEVEQEMTLAVGAVRKTGEIMTAASGEFTEDPASTLKRGNVVRAARNLLTAVARLLILADLVDVHRLMKSLQLVQELMERIRGASSQIELDEGINESFKELSA